MKYTIESKRLLFRPWEENDAFVLFDGWANNEEITKYLTRNPHQNIETTRFIINKRLKEYEEKDRINFAIVLKENNILIGSIDVVGYINNNPEIGYMLKKEYWNKGYMSEACLRVIKFLFSLGFKKIYIRAQVENIASNRVIQKCGGKFIECKEVERPLKHDKVMLNSYEITEI